MKRKVTINPIARIVGLPKEIVDDGFTGEADAYADAFTFTIVKPGTSLEKIAQSLELVLRDLKLRIEDEKAKEAAAAKGGGSGI